MTTYYDALSLRLPGRCANCQRLAAQLIRDRCQTCYDYRSKYHRERPAHLWTAQAPTWERVEDLHGNLLCDCGSPATWRMTVPSSARSKIRLLLCDACATLERRLAATHSWAGG